MPPPPPPAPPIAPAGPKSVLQVELDTSGSVFKGSFSDNPIVFIAKKVIDKKVANANLRMEVDGVTFVSAPTDKIKPLIVVDGVIMKDLDLNKSNPSTIEAINVLKGEKALAKYAEKGANGVVEITTKK
jgi:TonB-dependent SusC/RagA subfamily outer membrane receptor